ncbi:hypothetical protein [Aeromicrobium sp. CTD01-1L150]|uniref:hypothetical protein n=1 Tax=Aeromicrobium sp. CTD01-1L150 TaxID=3341830 RepID=UPI0035C07418
MKFRAALAIGLLAALIIVAVAVRERTPLRSEYCVAEVGDTRARVDLEQAQWASLMSAIGQTRGLPPRATTIAIATAFQESKVRNIDYGDRDSVGLFQQRPSQGWGTPEQIMDPHFAIAAFYDGLEQVDGYESMEITDAAQEVQRSAYPKAYAQHEPYARALASSLRGFSPGAFTCQVNPAGGGSFDAVRSDLEAAFGESDVRTENSSLTVAPAGDDDEMRSASGWAYAHYLVANAGHLRLASVAFDGRQWTAEDSVDGWVEHEPATDEVVVTLS